MTLLGAVYLRSVLVSFLLLFLVGRSSGQKALRLKYQDWVEDDDRIRVRSWYANAETPLGENWSLDVLGLVDSISGATPNGMPPSTDSALWLARIEEERRAGIVTLSGKRDEYDFSFEFGLSDEPDYLSRSYAVRAYRGLAEDTLTLHAGFSFTDDDVDSDVPGGPGLGWLSKRTPEFILGVYRILDAKSKIAINLSYGRPEGYLSDPYKQVGRTTVLFAGEPEEREAFFLYPENRPDERETFTVYLEGTRYFESLKGSVEASYRYFADDLELSGHTFEMQWFQRIGEKIVLRPFYRHYLQQAADFYLPSLDGTGISPVLQPDGTGHFYSADYRVSDLRTNTYGLKLAYFPRPDLSLDLSLDRYLMTGRDGLTSQEVYPDAEVLTIGIQWKF